MSWVMQLSAAVAGPASLAALSVVVRLYMQTVRNRDYLVGDDAVENDDGLVGQVEEIDERSQTNRRAIRQSEEVEVP